MLPGDKVPLHMTEGATMREVRGRCVAFTGRVGREATCTIYDDRPRMCQAMAPGSWACRAIRESWHLPSQG